MASPQQLDEQPRPTCAKCARREKVTREYTLGNYSIERRGYRRYLPVRTLKFPSARARELCADTSPGGRVAQRQRRRRGHAAARRQRRRVRRHRPRALIRGVGEGRGDTQRVRRRAGRRWGDTLALGCAGGTRRGEKGSLSFPPPKPKNTRTRRLRRMLHSSL